jgi:hypothetical protein
MKIAPRFDMRPAQSWKPAANLKKLKKSDPQKYAYPARDFRGALPHLPVELEHNECYSELSIIPIQIQAVARNAY